MTSREGLVANTRPRLAIPLDQKGRMPARRPARLEGIYVTALRTFSRNALSKPLGSQAHITGEREQASVTCC